MKFGPEHLIIDVELSSHCNANCFFCPREQMPFETLMEDETYQQVLQCIAQLQHKARLSFCGTGDATLHPSLVQYVANAHALSIETELTTNGILLTPALGNDLIAAGLGTLNISIAAQGNLYERIYGHDFEQIVQTVMHLAGKSHGHFQVQVSIIRELFSQDIYDKIKLFWQTRGIPLLVMEYTNRAGLLEKPMTRQAYDRNVLALCATPFKSIHIGSDGCFYLCSHDFARRVSFGHVRDTDICESLKRKLSWFEQGCNHDICQQCSNHPLNHRKQPDVKAVAALNVIVTDMVRAGV